MCVQRISSRLLCKSEHLFALPNFILYSGFTSIDMPADIDYNVSDIGRKRRALMPRPQRSRLICREPVVREFAPVDHAADGVVELTLDEL